MQFIKHKHTLMIALAVLTAAFFSLGQGAAMAANKCGGGDKAVVTTINIGCTGQGEAMADMAFAIIRFLSAGVGLVIVASLVFAGMQYISSRGDPSATADAVNRLRGTLLALVLFIFAFALLSYLVPKGFLK